MTYDELFAKIKTGNEFLGVKYAPDAHTFALRAVVWLHRPIHSDYFAYKNENACAECLNQAYPCLTIQAIEEELT